MAISRADVEHVAHLARLGLTEDELDRMAPQISHILEAMEALKKLDTSAIPPTAQIIPLATVMRDDVARPSWSVADILQNAPRTRDGNFLVPRVLDDES